MATKETSFNESDLEQGSPSVYSEEYEYESNPIKRFAQGFKRIDLKDDGYDTSEMTDLEKSIYATAKHPLSRRLQPRHIQMIALGGSIGTGLFIGNGYALSYGPANLLLSYSFVGFVIYLVMNALGELACQFPVSGAFTAYFTRFVDPSWGFVLGILYSCSWLVSFPSELIACSITMQYWTTSVNPAVWVAIFYIIIVSINMFGIKGYGEAEFVLSFIKVLAVIGFIILGICIICGVGKEGYIGGKYWTNPGSFNYGFKGFCQSLITAAFSYGGVELAALAAAETENTRKALPRAIKQVFWRICVFYFLTAIVIGCLVPYTDERLLSATSSQDISASPFVIAINNAGIKVVPHIMNAVILVAVVSVGNSSVYGCSRTIASLAAQKLLPSFVGYVDREGRPLVAIMITNAFGLLGFLVVSEDEDEVFSWFFSVCSLSSFFTWFAICLTHVRFRWALDYQKRDKDELIFPAPTGIYGSYLGMVLLLFIIACELYVSISPPDGSPDAEAFFKNCLSLPLLLVMWACHKTYYRTWGSLYVKLEDIDIDTGRREVDVEFLKQDLAEEKQLIASKPFYYRVYRFWC
ncbi:S-adenosylmethionine permease Sam3p [[Candida] jaroonii]|uniref:S-adenosylmethionine permease Sam3p n=1 Tax=[Candida] jaroonii TaxID=467808 RepID=A0ACA9Y5I6_9ASCO|nr:S-adenosylmethionine permease Sam3p [[Candida] jaroonii]